MTYKVLDICSGIGGFTLGHMISGGFVTVGFCEINDYCRQVLSLRFPHIPIIGDIHDVTVESLYRAGVGEIDGIIAGLPCPPFSLAGKQKASCDSRNLFNEFFRILRSIRPNWAIVENVPGLITAEKGQFFCSVLWEFASLGFDVEWGIMPAAEVGAVHLRERIWIIATNTKSTRRGTSWHQYPQAGADFTSIRRCDDAYANSQRLETWQPQSIEQTALAQVNGRSSTGFELPFAQPALCGSDDGFSYGLDGCLLTQRELTDWFAGATIPSFNRLSRTEVAALTSEERSEYRQLYNEYLAIRRQHKEQLKALGNAIVPQCAALIFDRLKQILMLQNSEMRTNEVLTV